MGLLNCEHHDKSFGITKINEFSKMEDVNQEDVNQEDVDMEDGRRHICSKTILICLILRGLLYLNNMAIPHSVTTQRATHQKQQIASYGCVK